MDDCAVPNNEPPPAAVVVLFDGAPTFPKRPVPIGFVEFVFLPNGVWALASDPNGELPNWNVLLLDMVAVRLRVCVFTRGNTMMVEHKSKSREDVEKELFTLQTWPLNWEEKRLADGFV